MKTMTRKIALLLMAGLLSACASTTPFVSNPYPPYNPPANAQPGTPVTPSQPAADSAATVTDPDSPLAGVTTFAQAVALWGEPTSASQTPDGSLVAAWERSQAGIGTAPESAPMVILFDADGRVVGQAQ
jgi:hypothetical protein